MAALLGMKAWAPDLSRRANALERRTRVKIGLYGGVANNMYVFAKALARRGADVLFIRDRADRYPFSQPCWEDAAWTLGYDEVNVISRLELKAVPQLMCEAMIAEAVLPIAATGSFGRMPGFPFLQMVQRKTQWILAHLDELDRALAS